MPWRLDRRISPDAQNGHTRRWEMETLTMLKLRFGRAPHPACTLRAQCAYLKASHNERFCKAGKGGHLSKFESIIFQWHQW
jgi:hypothetical protein